MGSEFSHKKQGPLAWPRTSRATLAGGYLEGSNLIIFILLNYPNSRIQNQEKSIGRSKTDRWITWPSRARAKPDKFFRRKNLLGNGLPGEQGKQGQVLIDLLPADFDLVQVLV